jgi:hypothetical protein
METYHNGRKLIYQKGSTSRIRKTSYLFSYIHNLQFHMSGPYIELLK